MFRLLRKLRFFVLFFAFGLLVVLVSSIAAQGPAGSGWWVPFTTQNASDDNVTMVVEAFHQTDGSNATYSSSAIVPGDGAVTFHPGLGGTCALPPSVAENGCRIAFSPDLPSPFEGSAVVSSSAEAVAFASVNNNLSGSVGVTGGKARSAYQGTGGSAASNTLFFPSFKNNFSGQSSILYVQAAGGDANVEITYTTQEDPPKTYVESKTIKANRMYAFVPAVAGVPSCGGGGGVNCRGGAIVASTTGPIAGTVIEYSDGASVAEFVLASRALTPADIGPSVIAPAMKNDFNGGTTGAAILNTSDTDATVDLSFKVTNVEPGCSVAVGHESSNTVNVPAKGTVVISRFQGNTTLPDCVLYAMTAEAQGPQELALTVNQTQVQAGQELKSKYNGFNTANATGTVLFPLIKENFGQNTSGLTLVNAGTIDTSVLVTYAGDSSTHQIETINLVPGQAVTLRQVYIPNPARFTVVSGSTLPVEGEKYAVTAVAEASGATIVGMSQEATLSGTRLDIKNYEGFNQ